MEVLYYRYNIVVWKNKIEQLLMRNYSNAFTFSFIVIVIVVMLHITNCASHLTAQNMREWKEESNS